MRVIVDGTSVLVYGPAHRYVHSAFSEELDATLYQAQLEDDLVRRGWSLELLTTHRRVRPRTPPPSRRDHSPLRLVA